MVKYEKITDSLKETTENLRRAEKDLLALQQEHKTESIKYTTRLQNTENSSMDLKSKVKELTESSDRIQKENQEPGSQDDESSGRCLGERIPFSCTHDSGNKTCVH